MHCNKHGLRLASGFFAPPFQGQHRYVPLLELDDGTRLTEGPAIVQ